ncbi:bifunctional 4-hydroxy-2-oxoglutarate aldolase/2-dehydro-3-deoxy-phosphogluconate aldolase [Glaciecola sp. KUL10]|jgi:2-dehydro-3-deoxyphosphogluconate aldolase/(4S)-4-hydroxy-2-oxoglutarate aldolase|uniref:bifunctional 4-hydroxy-2-oxoglutarate aldolase/2-dehydro-3-deoxy-phosphogluconate aldolase n=1 Tax=Glaciecola sp. (strain KUL10) TaxID=2161813 RepID=UPI000D7878D2|nr:bifunctional 4-hydroxy-2-oxoglutarate aldolase/2-dehydro-3-deoxy-phosphogluconate aldolase [Glaciecola sp. KUL10]GBL03333.1 keto-hydroxyglutarate-aldolase/keto-deoxy-phosphogluconate aldolase [Glaciecola sp. KUL10]
MNNWKYTSQEVFNQGPVVPVLVIDKVEDALPIAEALIAGGINVLEVTLRTEAAMDVIRTIAEALPEAYIGAGTVTNREQLKAVTDAGAKFAISPGLTADLLKAGKEGSIPLIPGISNISDLMKAKDAGYDHLKFFPAEAAGGVKALKSIGGPFPDIVFCPTGGISPSNYQEYLALPNVKCCGGSWLAPTDAIENKQWSIITDLAKAACDI